MVRSFIDRLGEVVRGAVAEVGRSQARRSGEIFERYEERYPSHQNAIDAVPGWSTAFPDHLGLSAGTLAMACDARIAWAIGCYGALDGRRVLELGPLEASHTLQLERAGAHVEAIEANRLAYFRCLVVKEVMSLARARFYLGDFVKWLERVEQPYDLIVASGVLYHMRDPLRLLRLLARASDALYLWTHYVDDTAMPPGDPRRGAFAPEVRIEEFQGMKVRLYPRSYLNAESSPMFSGGMRDEHYWMYKDDIFAVLSALGYAIVRTAHDDPDHVNGPSLSIFARRSAGAGTESAATEAAVPSGS